MNDSLLILLKGGWLWGPPSSGALGLVLSILFFIACGYAIICVIAFLALAIKKLFGAEDLNSIFLEDIYSYIITKSQLKCQYSSLLCTLVLWAVGISMAVLEVLAVIFIIDHVESIIVDAVLFIFSLRLQVFLFLLFKHFYTIWLYDLSCKSHKLTAVILWATLAATVVFWTAILCFGTISGKLNRFNRAIESCVESDIKETYCYDKFHLGVSRSEFHETRNELMDKGIVIYDSINGLVYSRFDTSYYNSCKLKIYLSFNNQDELYYMGFHLCEGDDFGFKSTILQRLKRERWKHLKVPESRFSNDGVETPIFNKCALNDSENLYNTDDQVFVKHNMMVVVRPTSVDFYNMPLFAKSPSWFH